MRLLVRGRNRDIAVEDGIVVPAEGRFDLVHHFPDGEVRPGLINAHDHLHRNHYGRLGLPPYRNARDWAHDIHARFPDRIAAGRAMPRREALLRGAWKNLRAGVTTVVHHDPWESDFNTGFPLRVPPIASADSLRMQSGLGDHRSGQPFLLHVAEGVDPQAGDEVRLLDALGLLGPDLIAVHALGMDEDASARFRSSGAGLCWCPSSNQFLFGRTCSSSLLDEGIDLLLGTDSLLTGVGDLLDELRFARALGLVSDRRLEAAVGEAAARRLRLPVPSLEPGSAADLIVLGRPLLEASAQDVRLVMVAGEIRIGPSASPEPMNRVALPRH